MTTMTVTTAITKDTLNQYTNLIAEIRETRAKIARVERKIEKIERDGTVRDIVSGGYGGIQHFHIEGFPYPEYEKLIAELMRRKARLEVFEAEQIRIVSEIEEFISQIEDSKIRRIINLRVIEGHSWNGVADEIGGNATEDSVRKLYTRYMKGEKKNEID